MKKKVFFSLLAFMALSMSIAFADEPTIGGHIKFSAFDNTNGQGKANGAKFTNKNQNMGAGIKEFIMYVKKELSDTVAVEISPKFSWSTSATPKLGTVLTKQLTNPATQVGVETAFFEMQLPDQYSARLGYFAPKISWDYGDERFWDEEYNANKFTLTALAYHDTGLELYKEYEVAGQSLPMYLYALNGNGAYGYGNRGRLALGMDVEPEVMGVKTHAAYVAGQSDDLGNLSVKRVVGVDYTAGNFEVRSEAAFNTVQKKNVNAGVHSDQKTKGYYVKAFYKVMPDLKTMVAYSIVDQNTATDGNRYKDWTLGAVYNITDSTLLQLQDVISDWSSYHKTNQIQFNRLVAGIRTTF